MKFYKYIFILLLLLFSNSLFGQVTTIEVADTNGVIATDKITGTTIGKAVLNSTNPGAITFGRANADNSFSWLSDSDFRTAIGLAIGTNVLALNGSAASLTSFPTLNQSTTGSAASLSISGKVGLMSFTGLEGTNRIKTVRDAADTILELGGSYTPTGTWNWSSVTWSNVPTLNQNTTGNAATASALSANPTDCSEGQFANAIAANGNLTCATPSGSGFSVTDITGQTDDTTPDTTATAVLAQGGSLIESTIAQIGTAIGVIDWTADQEATNIHAGNIPDLSGTYVAVTANTIDAIGDAAADGTVNFAGYKNIWTSTLNSAGAVHTFTNTTADLTADVSFMDFKYTDDGDANGFFLRGYDNSGNDLKWSINANGVGSFSSITAPGGISIAATAAGGQYNFNYEATGNGSNYGGFGVYGNLTHSTIYAYPLDAPFPGATLSCTTPSAQDFSDTSSQSTSVCTWVYKDAPQTPISGDGDVFDDNCTGACLRGGTFRTTVDGSPLLPNAFDGFLVTITDAGGTPTIEPLATGTDDTIIYNETSCGQGVNLVGDGTTGGMVILQYGGADTILAYGNGFACGS
ncbi:MAG: hypothetical protein M0P71_15145 [Melioribacteraceae bacterium]|nr:hypothetical protein [Melioribacteraceae bacterium]